MRSCDGHGLGLRVMFTRRSLTLLQRSHSTGARPGIHGKSIGKVWVNPRDQLHGPDWELRCTMSLDSLDSIDSWRNRVSRIEAEGQRLHHPTSCKAQAVEWCLEGWHQPKIPVDWWWLLHRVLFPIQLISTGGCRNPSNGYFSLQVCVRPWHRWVQPGWGRYEDMIRHVWWHIVGCTIKVWV